MIKKILPFFIIVSLFFSYPADIFAANHPTKTSRTINTKVTTTKKKATHKKKRVTKRKERLITEPPLITLDTAPHSAKKVSKSKKKKSTKKKTTKKKV